MSCPCGERANFFVPGVGKRDGGADRRESHVLVERSIGIDTKIEEQAARISFPTSTVRIFRAQHELC